MNRVLPIIFLLTIALFAKSAKSNDSSNDGGSLNPDGALSLKDIVQDPTLRDAIKSDEEDSDELRIVGGSQVKAHSVPHQAALLLDGRYFCGGSLISDSWVLTSASCVYGKRTALVTLGAHNINLVETTTQKITANSFTIHPNFNQSPLQNNVALIKLPYTATINVNVSPVCLVPYNINITDGRNMVATGWGKTADSAPAVNIPVLRSVTVPTISNRNCSVYYGSSVIANGTMCTSTTGSKGICIGDEGGPLTISGKTVDGSPNKQQCQAGISSFVSSTGCQSGVPAGYARVSYHMDWITRTTGIQPCEKCSGSRMINSSLFVLLSVTIAIYSNILQL